MFDDEEQNQDETTPLPARLRFAYRLMGLDPDSDRQLGGSPSRAMQRQGGTPETRAVDGDQSQPRLQQEPWIPRKLSIGQPLMQRDAAPVQRADGNRSSGIATGMAAPLPVIDGTRSWSVLQRKPQTPRKLTIGQRLMGLDAASGQRGNGGSGIAPKLTIGQRLMGLDGRRRFSVGNPQAQQGTFDGSGPTSAVPGSLKLIDNRWFGDGQNAFARDRQTVSKTRFTGRDAVADGTTRTKARSRIPRPAAAPDVERSNATQSSQANIQSSDGPLPSDPRLTLPFPPRLSTAVGPGQPNRYGDVLLIQRLYNRLIDKSGMITDDADSPLPKKIPESGKFDELTKAAIRDLEGRQFYGMSNPAGVITAKGSLFKSMVGARTRSGANYRALSPEMREIAKTMVPLGASPSTASARSNAGVAEPPDNISKYLPWIVSALKEQHLDDPEMLLMALATIRAETDGFAPVSERRSPWNTTPKGHAFDIYDHKNGNRGRGEGELFRGRGFVQLTGRSNYATIGNQIGHPELVTNPDRANDPQVAALILAQFLKNHEKEIRQAIKANDLAKARRLVNGGSHGLNEFSSAFRIGRRYITNYLKA